MKINFKKKQAKVEEMYQVGNVIKAHDDNLFLVAKGSVYGYALVNLTDNLVTKTYETLEELADRYGAEDDILVDAEILLV